MDYSPLDNIKGSAQGSMAAFALASSLVALATFVFLFKSTPIGLALLPLLAALIITTLVLYPKSRAEQRANQEAINRFATVNNWQYAGKDQAKSFVPGPGTLFSVGRNHKTLTVMSGMAGAAPCNLFEHEYVTGYGKSTEIHKVAIMRMMLPRPMPQMVIDSLVEGSSALPIDFTSSQRIQLEGDFNRFFACYAPTEYGITLLTILGPDTMLELMQHSSSCDIEIIDNYLYLYWATQPSGRSGYEHIFTTFFAVLKAMGDKITKSDVYATPEQAAQHSGVESARGVRLKRSRLPKILLNTALVGGAALIGFGLGIPEYSYMAFIGLIALGVVFVGFVIYTLFLSPESKRHELERRFGK